MCVFFLSLSPSLSPVPPPLSQSQSPPPPHICTLPPPPRLFTSIILSPSLSLRVKDTCKSYKAQCTKLLLSEGRFAYKRPQASLLSSRGSTIQPL